MYMFFVFCFFHGRESAIKTKNMLKVYTHSMILKSLNFFPWIGLTVWRFDGVIYFKHMKTKVYDQIYNIKETIVMSPRCVPYVMKSVLPQSVLNKMVVKQFSFITFETWLEYFFFKSLKSLLFIL